MAREAIGGLYTMPHRWRDRDGDDDARELGERLQLVRVPEIRGQSDDPASCPDVLRLHSTVANSEGSPVPDMRILVVEDEPKTAGFLSKGLRENGFVVDIASRGEDALHLAATVAFDLIILDVMLPTLDGWSVLSAIRQDGRQTPVLFLTARDAVEDRVHGLELGADDYLVKPFAFSEVLARLRSILRRGPNRQPDTLRVADLEVDIIRHRASRAGRRLNLTPKEFSLLSLLARRTGEVLSRTLIAEQVWDVNFESDTNVVDVHVRRLRSKVDDRFAKPLIHTVRGVGYVLEDRQ